MTAPRRDPCEARLLEFVARIERQGFIHWSHALTDVLQLHGAVVLKAYQDGYDQAARDCGPLSRREGLLRATELVLEVLDHGDKQQRLLEVLERLARTPEAAGA